MELIEDGFIILNRYQIVGNISSGGQAFGYSATDLECPAARPWEKNVFVKQYHDLSPTREVLGRIQGMTNLIQKRLAVDSQYICLPAEIGITHNSIVLVFPFVRGRSLQDWLASEELTPALRLRFAIALAKAIYCIHRAGLIHLDIKPDNVMIQERKQSYFVQLIDLDAARIDGIGLRDHLIGTHNYCSPEHLSPDTQGEVGKDSDVFSLGILLCQLLCGVYPFASSNNFHESVLKEDFRLPPLSISTAVEGLLRACLSVNRSLRPSAQKIGATLVQFRRSHGDLDLTDLSSLPPLDSIHPNPMRSFPAGLNPTPLDISPPVTPPPESLSGAAIGRRTMVAFHSILDPRHSFQVDDCVILDIPHSDAVRRKSTFPHVYLEIVENKAFITKIRRNSKGFFAHLFTTAHVILNQQCLNFDMRTRLQDGDRLTIGGCSFCVKIEKVNS